MCEIQNPTKFCIEPENILYGVRQRRDVREHHHGRGALDRMHSPEDLVHILGRKRTRVLAPECQLLELLEEVPRLIQEHLDHRFMVCQSASPPMFSFLPTPYFYAIGQYSYFFRKTCCQYGCFYDVIVIILSFLEIAVSERERVHADDVGVVLDDVIRVRGARQILRRHHQFV